MPVFKTDSAGRTSTNLARFGPAGTRNPPRFGAVGARSRGAVLPEQSHDSPARLGRVFSVCQQICKLVESENQCPGLRPRRPCRWVSDRYAVSADRNHSARQDVMPSGVARGTAEGPIKRRRVR